MTKLIQRFTGWLQPLFVVAVNASVVLVDFCNKHRRDGKAPVESAATAVQTP